MDEEANKPYETMNSGGRRLSAAEKEKQKAADADEADLPPAALVPQSAGEIEPARDDAAANNWHTGGGADVCRQLLFGTPCGGTSEIEELPPSPPAAAAASSRPRLPALKNAAGASAGMAAALAGLRAALESQMRELQQLRRERDEALEEFWKPVVPQRQPQCNKSKSDMNQAELEYMKALEEFWKPVVPVPQRNNNKRKINWNRIISLIALTSGLVSYISLWTLLPVNNLSHIVGTISTRLIIRVWFWLLVLYALYLILRHIHGLLGKHQ